MSAAEQTEAIRKFLGEVPVFADIAPELREKLVAALRPMKFPVGGALMTERALPDDFHILMRGKARLLGMPRRAGEESVSLGLFERGAFFGAASLASRRPLETVIASTEVLTLALAREEFLRLWEDEADFRALFANRGTLSEAWLALARSDAPITREAVSAAAESARVFCLPADREKLEQIEGAWEFFCGDRNLPREQIAALPAAAPLRVVAFPAALLKTAAEIPVEIAPELEAAPERSGEFPLVPAEGEAAEAVACVGMLSRHFGTSLHRHVLDRALRVREGGRIGMAQLGAVAELAGLGSRRATMPPERISNDELPAIVRCRGALAVAHARHGKLLRVASPRLGRIEVDPAELDADAEGNTELLEIAVEKQTERRRLDLSWFIPALAAHKRALVEVFVASFFVQLLALGNPLIIQVIIDKVLVQNSLPTLNVLGVLLLIVAFGEVILGGLRTYLFVDTTNRIDISLGAKIIDHLYKLPLAYFQRRRVGEIASRVGELENIRQFLTGTALTVVLDAVFSVVYVAVMLFYSVPLTLTALSTVPILLAATFVVSPWLQRLIRKRAERNAETQAHLVETLTGIQTIKAQSLEMHSRWEWHARYTRFIRQGFKTVLTATTFRQFSTLLNHISELAVLWVGAYLVLGHKLTLGQLIAFRIVAGYVTGPLLRLGSIWQEFQEVNLSMERLRDVMDATPEQTSDQQKKIPMPQIAGEVAFENVTFGYAPGTRIVSNVNANVPAGAMVAVVGGSGSGKSTLLKLLARLYPTDEGRILVDGYDISKMELYSFRRQIGLVLQDNLLFEGSVQENILLGKPDAAPEAVIEAARAAEAHDFIMELPEGYNTQIGEQGRGLSGGQRQRVAIARILLQDPRLVILDEATSALDYPTERQVCRNLAQSLKGRTVFLVTHRLRSIEHADVILFLEQGRLLERGSHEELMAMRGRYYSLYQQQGQEESA
jgi:ATP-binding cassette subfamily B protein